MDFSSALSRNVRSAVSISPSGAGKETEINRKLLIPIFDCVKALGFDAVYTLCELKQNSSYSPNDIEQIIASKCPNLPEQANMVKDALNNLDNNALRTVQNIIHEIQTNKSLVLDAFKKGNDRNAVFEIASIHDNVDWITSRQILATGGSLRLKEGSFSFGEEIELLSYQDVLVLFKEDLAGLDLSNLELSELDLSGGNLTGTDLTNSRTVGTNFTGAGQQEMIVNGVDLSSAIGIEFLPATVKWDNQTKFRSCQEILSDPSLLTGQKLKSLVGSIHLLTCQEGLTCEEELFNCILSPVNRPIPEPKPLSDDNDKENERLHYEIKTAKVFELMSKSLIVEKMTDEDIDVVHKFCLTYFNRSKGLISSPSMFNKLKEMLPRKIAAANTSKLSVYSSSEARFIAEYVNSLEDQKTFIENNRGFFIQFLCIGMGEKHKGRIHFESESLSLYEKLAQQFIAICSEKMVFPNASLFNEAEKLDGITPSQPPDRSADIFLSGVLPSELYFKINEDLSPEARIHLSSTSKFHQQIFEKICASAAQLKQIPEVEQLIKEGISAADIFRNYPQYRKDEYVLSDRAGLIHVVRNVKVMGPLAIQKIMKGELTLEAAAKQREEFDIAHQYLNNAELVRARYVADGSISGNDATRKLTIEERDRITSEAIQMLIDTGELSIKVALAFDSELAELIVDGQITIKQCGELQEGERKLLTRFVKHIKDGQISAKNLLTLLGECPLLANNLNEIIVDSFKNKLRYCFEELTIKEIVFLDKLHAMYDSNWDELMNLVRPNNSKQIPGRSNRAI